MACKTDVRVSGEPQYQGAHQCAACSLQLHERIPPKKNSSSPIIQARTPSVRLSYVANETLYDRALDGRVCCSEG